ncbi:MAG: hypothetical protein PVG47_08565 [Chromatiales bacterium]|mgnify:CR=1 FL=1
MEEPEPQVTRINGYLEPLEKLLAVYGLGLERVGDTDPVPGSFWGEPEAGLIGNRLYVRQDTPLHSAFHEACHYICMDENRRRALDTNAGGSVAEENGVCYLQILLADQLAGYDRERMMNDMDAWGYSFRLGSSRAWFEQDADDARKWLLEAGIILDNNTPSWKLNS